jgi:hypothetical protein
MLLRRDIIAKLITPRVPLATHWTFALSGVQVGDSHAMANVDDMPVGLR